MDRRVFLKTLTIASIGSLIARTPVSAAPAWDCYLTFDAGFSTNEQLTTGSTLEVLETLKEYTVPATFFPNGRNLNTWEGSVLTRILLEGHALGNRLWQETGNLVADSPATTLLAAQFFKAEKKIRAMIQSTNQQAADLYRKQPKLYRRPGGDDQFAAFLDPANYVTLTREPYLKPYADVIDWLKEVYDYSGWHVGVGVAKAFSSYGLTRQIVSGTKELRGVEELLCVNKLITVQAKQGIIIQLRDGDKLTPESLPQIILQLKAKGAIFKTLPRPIDKPNSFTIGVEDDPVADASGGACS
jgi:peptidoglycan/xylan/chitin deacetylase (PgdA/CDA1 family)